MLDERKLKVLFAIINSYISDAEPIGSRTISKKYDLGVSSATIRNEMSDLEDLGYLNKPHSSAGRVPSDKAYRFYVDDFLKSDQTSDNIFEGLKIKEKLLQESGELSDLIQNSAKLLSALTSYTSFVASPRLRSSQVKQIQLISLDELGVLIVIVCDNATIKNTVYRPEEAISSDQLQLISNFLTSKLKGRTVGQLMDLLEEDVFQEMYEYKSFIDGLIPVINSSLQEMISVDLYYEGLTKILNFPEFKDIEKAKSFISFIEDKALMLDLLSSSNKEDLDIIIGSENIYAPTKDLSFITATYTMGGQIIGKVGLVGPTRMDYLNLIDTVQTFSNNITEVLNLLINK